MNGNVFLRTAMVLLVGGVALGMYMGATQNFTAAPVHAHLNLVGGVLMFLAGLFYNSRPDLGRRAVGMHYGLHLAGAVLLAAGIYSSVTGASWAGPVVGSGAVLTLLALLVFAVNVFRASGTGAAPARDGARAP